MQHNGNCACGCSVDVHPRFDCHILIRAVRYDSYPLSIFANTDNDRVVSIVGAGVGIVAAVFMGMLVKTQINFHKELTQQMACASYSSNSSRKLSHASYSLA